MTEPDSRWDGKRWISADGRWASSGSQWIALSSTLPLAARVSIYAAVGAAITVPLFFVLILAWLLTGPGWDASPPDIGTSLVQIALTAACAGAVFWVGWFLIRVDRRDWWLGVVLALPWIGSAAALALTYPPWLLLSASLLLAAVLPTLGPIAGRWRQWPSANLAVRAIQSIPVLLQAVVRSAGDVASDALQFPRKM
jgi:hypothetical protein